MSARSINIVDKEAVLIIEPPSYIIFRGPFNRPVFSSLCLVNPSTSKIIFKIKTSAPSIYFVRPNFGVVQPQNFVEVEVVRTAFDYNPKDIKIDRFLIQSLIAPAQVTGINEYWTNADPSELNSWTIRCAFELLALSPNRDMAPKVPVASISAAIAEPKRSTGGEALQQKQIALLRSELEDVINENENLRKEKAKLMQEIERLAFLPTIIRRHVAPKKKIPPKVKLSFVDYLILSLSFAVVCFLIGKFVL